MMRFDQLDGDQRAAHSTFAYQLVDKKAGVRQPLQQRSWHHWLSNVEKLRTQLTTKPSGYWPVYYSDSYVFSIALFALWSTNRIPLLLPDMSARTLQTVEHEFKHEVGGYLVESNALVKHTLKWEMIENVRPPDHADTLQKRLYPLDCQVALATSGSTGDGIIVDKTHGQLILEALVYADRWVDDMRGATFFATVSHQHIYGLLFKILLPMALQRPFVAELLPNPRNLLHKAEQFDAVVWVASPAQLKRLNPGMVTDLTTSNVECIFSSGGLLDADAAQCVEEIFATPAYEIYGSTETGGIATRQQYADRRVNTWQFLSEVETQVDATGRLGVCSPYTDNVWLYTGDQVQLHDDATFSLQGRVDKIVKLEEKRISLTATERQLDDLAEVAQARVIVLPGQREQLASVIILTQLGNQELLASGRNHLVRQIRTKLLAELASHAVPRRYRFVQEFPTNSQSKIRFADLIALFEQRQRNVLPTVLSVENSPQTKQIRGVLLALRVPVDLDYFGGHFADFPLVPGVAQMLWVQHFAKLHLGFSGQATKMSKVKFKAMIRPEQVLMMQLNFALSTGKLNYRLYNAGQEFATGTMWDELIKEHGSDG